MHRTKLFKTKQARDKCKDTRPIDLWFTHEVLDVELLSPRFYAKPIINIRIFLKQLALRIYNQQGISTIFRPRKPQRCFTFPPL